MVEANEGSKTLRILLLEDNQADVALALRQLKTVALKVHVDTSTNASTFIKFVNSSSYDVILGDYRLPDWTGLEAIRYLRSMGIDTPFILVTGTLGDELAIECIKAGATDYVLKDNLERLPVVVRRAVEEHRVRMEKDWAEEELRRSEEQYRLLFEANPNPMWVYHPETLRFLAVNETAVANYGYSRAEFLEMKVSDIRPRDDVSRFLDHCRRAINQASVGPTIWKHQKKDGTLIDVEITAASITFHGEGARLILANDISERVKAELESRETTELYRAIIDGAPFGIYQANRVGRILLANPAMVNMLGYEHEREVMKLNLNTDVFVNSAERENYAKNAEQAPGRVLHYESRWKRKDGSPITVKLYGRAVRRNDEETRFEVFVENITEQRSLEQQFRHAQKMEAIGRLAGGIAHDFNNLLMVITSFAQLTSEFPSDRERVSRYAKQIRDAAGRAAGLTRQLLAFSRKQVQELQVVNLNQLIIDFCKLLPRLIGEDIEMVTKTSEQECLIYADRGQIEQVIMNLVVNARDAMPHGGKLTIEATKVELDEQHGWRHEANVPPGNYVMLAVSDTGCGMDIATQSRLFEPFFTTKEPGKGTGLGLATVYGIVKQSKGYVWVYSELKKGTTFKIYLPRIEQPVAEPLASLGPVAPSLGNETILLAEDEELLRRANREFLESRGYTVLEAGNGNEALQLCLNYDDQIDLLLTDVVMPGKGGPDLAKEVLTIRPEIRVLYMSGHTDNVLDTMLLSSKGSGFLQKPCSLEALEQKIRSILDA